VNSLPRLFLHTRRIACLIALFVVGLTLTAASDDKLLDSAVQRWGPAVTPRFNAWRSLVVSMSAATDSDRLRKANEFVNKQTQFGEDISIWNQTDYWATPLETIGKAAGDCEDFAIYKYFTLKEMGVAPDKLRLIYVRAKTGNSDVAPAQAHMVLAYYSLPDAEPLVLDNLVAEIRPASRRPDLVPVFSFNSAGVFSGIAGGGAVAAGVGRLSRWEDLLRRARAEGFD
jgi:predicted transglutaminase-like cysteine proteinase